jgi:broad specificity phosphatase PhoE
MVGKRVNRDEFFAELDGLTEKEIEERLPNWDMERLALAQEYVDTRLARTRTPQPYSGEAIGASETPALLALRTAKAANIRAIAALILSVGAMLAAILCSVIVVLR